MLMKRVLSLIIALAMVLTLIVAMNVTAYAAFGDGEWNVYARRGSYEDIDPGDPIAAPGYEYTTDGLHMIPTDWSNSRAWGICQTKDQVDLRQGVYMEVRIDNFTYESDKWFGFNIWEERVDKFPNTNDTQPLGAEVLLRTGTNTKDIATFQLNHHTAVGGSLVTGGETANSSFENKYDENGCAIYTLQITWSITNGYTVIINGQALNKTFCQTVTDFFDGDDNDGQAYVSFSLQTGAKNGTVE